jgi:hypothetical protein
MPTLEQVREAYEASFFSVPLNRHLGLSLERRHGDGAKVVMPAKPGIVGPEGHHSPAAVYVAAEAAAAVRLCDEIAPPALEMQMAALFFAVSASFELGPPRGGTLEATAELTKGFEQARPGDAPLKKATLEVTAMVRAETGEPAAEQRVRFYVRFMKPSRIRELAPESSEIIRILGT